MRELKSEHLTPATNAIHQTLEEALLDYRSKFNASDLLSPNELPEGALVAAYVILTELSNGEDNIRALKLANILTSVVAIASRK